MSFVIQPFGPDGRKATEDRIYSAVASLAANATSSEQVIEFEKPGTIVLSWAACQFSDDIDHPIESAMLAGAVELFLDSKPLTSNDFVPLFVFAGEGLSPRPHAIEVGGRQKLKVRFQYNPPADMQSPPDAVLALYVGVRED